MYKSINIHLACLLFFLLNTKLTKANYFNKNTKAYVFSCSSEECQNAITQCSDNLKCFGEHLCKKCIGYFPECNSACADDLFNKTDYLTLNGQNYLICDSQSKEQKNACNIVCRAGYFSYSECTLEMNFPICKCSSFPFTSTTIAPTTTEEKTTQATSPTTTTTTTTSKPSTTTTSLYPTFELLHI
jgi:hypothetical protein